MNSEIYVTSKDGRYWLSTPSGKRVGSRYGYLTERKARAALWWLNNGKEAIQATYKNKREMNLEMKHFKSL